MGVLNRLLRNLSPKPHQVMCARCGERFLNLAGTRPPYTSAKCQTLARAQADIDLIRGMKLDSLPPLATLQNNVRQVVPRYELPKGSDHSVCPGCGETLWLQALVTLRPTEAQTDDSLLVLPHGPQAAGG